MYQVKCTAMDVFHEIYQCQLHPYWLNDTTQRFREYTCIFKQFSENWCILIEVHILNWRYTHQAIGFKCEYILYSGKLSEMKVSMPLDWLSKRKDKSYSLAAIGPYRLVIFFVFGFRIRLCVIFPKDLPVFIWTIFLTWGYLLLILYKEHLSFFLHFKNPTHFQSHNPP